MRTCDRCKHEYSGTLFVSCPWCMKKDLGEAIAADKAEQCGRKKEEATPQATQHEVVVRDHHTGEEFIWYRSFAGIADVSEIQRGQAKKLLLFLDVNPARFELVVRDSTWVQEVREVQEHQREKA